MSDITEEPSYLVTTPSCCTPWKDLMSSFDWFEIGGNPNYLCMPSLGGHKWRINYCPSCGSPVRNFIRRKNEQL